MLEPCTDKDDLTTSSATENEKKTEQQQQQPEDVEYFERRIEFEAPEVLLPRFSPPEGRGVDEKPKEEEEAVASASELVILQHWDSDESGVVWDASLLLAKYLERLAAKEMEDSSSKSKKNHPHHHHLFNGSTVVELGSGTGFLGLWLAAMGARVLLTDLPTNLELMRRNLLINSSSTASEAEKESKMIGVVKRELVSIAAFDWRDGGQRQTERDFLDWAPVRAIDYFILADCLYYREGIEAIYSLLDWVLGDLQTAARFLIAYEDRADKAEMIAQFLLVIRHNPALRCREIPAAELHPDYCSPDLHLLLIVAQKEGEN